MVSHDFLKVDASLDRDKMLELLVELLLLISYDLITNCISKRFQNLCYRGLVRGQQLS